MQQRSACSSGSVDLLRINSAKPAIYRHHAAGHVARLINCEAITTRNGASHFRVGSKPEKLKASKCFPLCP
jgi:hypothetical protein